MSPLLLPKIPFRGLSRVLIYRLEPRACPCCGIRTLVPFRAPAVLGAPFEVRRVLVDASEL